MRAKLAFLCLFLCSSVAGWAQPTLDSLTANLTTLVGGFGTTGRATLTAAAPSGGVIVMLVSDTPKILVPSSIKVLLGKTFRTFAIKTGTVTSQTIGTITGTANSVSRSVTLTLKIGGLLSLAVNPNTFVGGGTSTGKVTLSGPAPNGGRSVALSTLSGPISAPTSVIVPAGATFVTFTVSSTTVSSTTNATLQAKLGSVQRNAAVTLTAAPQTTTIEMALNTYDPIDVQAKPGTTLTWVNKEVSGHTVTSDLPGGPSSPSIGFEQQWSWQVPANAVPGTKIYYHCIFHGTPGNGSTFGTGMVGVITVISP